MSEPRSEAIIALRDAVERAAHFSFLDSAHNPNEHVLVRRRDWEEIGRRLDTVLAAALSGDSRANGEPGLELDAAWAEAEAALPEGAWLTIAGPNAPGDYNVEAWTVPAGSAFTAQLAKATAGPLVSALADLASRLRALREEAT